MSEDNKLHCEDCEWWKLIHEKDSELNSIGKGRCHGRAPTGMPVIMPAVNRIANTVTPQIIEVTVWPITGASCEICGDFKMIVTPVEALESEEK